MANKETTYTPKYFLGGLTERFQDRGDARKEYRKDKKNIREQKRAAKKEARQSKRDDIKEMRQGKKDQIAEIKSSDMTRSEKRLAIKEIRSGFRDDKKARKQRKRTEIKGAKAAARLEKHYQRREKLDQIADTGGIKGKIAEKRSDRINRRMAASKGRYGRLEERAPDAYMESDKFGDMDFTSMNQQDREQWREDEKTRKEEERKMKLAKNEEGQPQSDVELRDDVPSSEFASGIAPPPGGERPPGAEGPDRFDGTFAGGGFTIKYNEGGLTINLLKKLKEKTKNPKKKELIQARIDKKEKKKFTKDNSELGFGEGSLREQIKTQHKEEVEEIKKKHEDAEHESLKEHNEEKDTKAGPPKGEKGMKVYAQGGMNNEEGGVEGSLKEIKEEKRKHRKRSKYNMGKKGMKVNEMGHGVLILLGKKSDKK